MQFSKMPHITFTERAMREGKKTPGPGSYNPKQIEVKKKGMRSTCQRFLGFIDEAKYKGMNNPLNYDGKMTLVSPRAKSMEFKKYGKLRDFKLRKKKGTSRIVL